MQESTSPTSLVTASEVRGTTVRIIEALAEHMEPMSLEPGEALFREGDSADHLYFLTSGDLKVTEGLSEEKERERISGETFVGERELFTREPRRTTVTALSACELRVMSGASFRWLRDNDAELGLRLLMLIAQRLRQSRIVTAVRALLDDLDPDAMDDLLDVLELVHLPAEDVLPDQRTSLYLVVSGRLQVERRDGPVTTERDIGPVELVGGFDLLAPDGSSSPAVAKRDTDVLRLGRRSYEQLVARHPALALQLTERIISQERRFRRSPKQRGESQPMTLTVVPSGDVPDAVGFAHALASTLESFGPALVLSSAELDRRFGEPVAQITRLHPLYPLMSSVLDEIESEYRFLLLLPDETATEWTRRCMRRADRILVVADAESDPQPGLLERSADRIVPSTRRELVLLQAKDTLMPSGTRRWLDARDVSCHHHVRREEPDHLARVARRLSGRAVGLVLSGGGARGYAHLGVWRALEELEVSVDCVGGTSMGALLAGAFAMGLRYDQVAELSSSLADPKALFDYTIPLTSLMKSRKLNRLCRRVYGERAIEDLWIPYFAVVTNLSTAEPSVRQTGPLWKAVRSSISIPGVFAPVVENDEVLVDGGVMNNFPVDLMRKTAESDHVIAVNVVPPTVRKRKYDVETEASGWWLLFSRLNPFSRRLKAPALVRTILRALEVNSIRLSRRTRFEAQLLLEPDVRTIGLLDFGRYQKAADIGYAASKTAIQQWLIEDGDVGTRHVVLPEAVNGRLPQRTVAAVDSSSS